MECYEWTSQRLKRLCILMNTKSFLIQGGALDFKLWARIYALFRLCVTLSLPHPFSGTASAYMLLVAVLGSKRPRQVPTATYVPCKGCDRLSLSQYIERAYIHAIFFIDKCVVEFPHLFIVPHQVFHLYLLM